MNPPVGFWRPRLFFRDLGMYFWLFLPATTLAGMAYRAVFNQPAVAPEWDIGWNPILWLIMSIPWLLPTVIGVPVLHLSSCQLGLRVSRRTVRVLLAFATPLLFVLIMLGLWGGSYLEAHLLLPLVVGAGFYGGLLGIPREPAGEIQEC